MPPGCCAAVPLAPATPGGTLSCWQHTTPARGAGGIGGEGAMTTKQQPTTTWGLEHRAGSCCVALLHSTASRARTVCVHPAGCISMHGSSSLAVVGHHHHHHCWGGHHPVRRPARMTGKTGGLAAAPSVGAGVLETDPPTSCIALDGLPAAEVRPQRRRAGVGGGLCRLAGAQRSEVGRQGLSRRPPMHKCMYTHAPAQRQGSAEARAALPSHAVLEGRSLQVPMPSGVQSGPARPAYSCHSSLRGGGRRVPCWKGRVRRQMAAQSGSWPTQWQCHR